MSPEQDKYRLLVEKLPDGFAYHQVVTDSDGSPGGLGGAWVGSGLEI